MPCIAAPLIPIPKLPSVLLGAPAISLSAATPTLTAKIPCCTFKLPSVAIAVTIPPLGIGATVAITTLTTVLGQVNAFLRQLQFNCPV